MVADHEANEAQRQAAAALAAGERPEDARLHPFTQLSGVGLVFTSVWLWQVAAFCFATVFTQRFDLDRST